MKIFSSFRSLLLVLPFSLVFLFNPNDLYAQAHASAGPAPHTTGNAKNTAFELYELTNKQVKDVYSATLGFLESAKTPKALAYRKSLVASQNGWLSYRSGHCQLLSAQTDDNPSDPAFYQCIADINQARINELEGLQARLKSEFSVISEVKEK